MKKLVDYIERPLSVVTGKKTEFLYEFENFPLFCGCVDTPSEKDLSATMRWEIDPESGTIQLSRLIPSEILYQEQHLDGVGQTWAQYYQDFATYILDQKLAKIVEIGGGKGILAHKVLANDKDVRWMIIEPNPIAESSSRLTITEGFFDEKPQLNSDTSAIVMSQVFEHSYEPQKMAKQLANSLSTGAKVIIAYPQIKKWLKNNFTSALNFEHTMLIDDFLPMIFQRAGFILDDKTVYKDHSIFYTFVKTDDELVEIKAPNFYQEYKKIFNDFILYHKRLVAELNDKILMADEPVYLFGAHIFSSYLFAFGLSDKVDGILDNGDLKKNRRFYGTNFVITGPQILKGKGKINVILKAGMYNEEIKSDILENINNEVIFW